MIAPQEKVEAMRARFMDLASAPIKKVAEVRARKRARAMKKLEKAKQRANAIANSTELTTRAKQRAIEKIMKKAERKETSNQVYVVAHGPGSKSKIGSGKGRKGKVKYVDKRMIADSRGEKRAAKKGKQRRKKKNKKAAGKRKR